MVSCTCYPLVTTIYKISPSPNLVDTSNPAHVQRVPPRQNLEDPFVVAFSTAGVDNDTGYVINWVTAISYAMLSSN